MLISFCSELIILFNPRFLNLSSNSPVACFTSSTILIFSKFNYIFPVDTFDASTRSSLSLFSLCDLFSNISIYSLAFSS